MSSSDIDGSEVTWNFDSRRKSVIKAISWRIVASLVIFLCVYVFTGEALLSLNITLIDVFLKLILYYAHERVWMRFQF